MNTECYLEDSNTNAEKYMENGDENADLVESKTLTSDEQFKKNELLSKLKETEDEIDTLRQVLGSKLRLAHELRRSLGITSIDELKDDISHGIRRIQSLSQYKTTANALQSAKIKTQSSLGVASGKVAEKWCVLKQSNTFKNLNDKVGNVSGSIKRHLIGSRSGTTAATIVDQPTDVAENATTDQKS